MDVLLLWKAEENIIIIKNTKKSMPKDSWKRKGQKQNPITKQNKNTRNKNGCFSQSHIAFRSFTFFLLPQKASSFALFLISQFLESQ